MQEHSNRFDSTGRMPPKIVTSFLVVLVLLGTVLRVYELGEESIWYDEGATLVIADWVGEGFDWIRPSCTTDPPMFLVLLFIWRGIGELFIASPLVSVEFDAWLRLLPCLLGILGIPLCFFAGRAVFREDRVALAAALLFAVSPLQIFYAQELRAYTLYVVWCLAALWFLVRALENDRRRDWIALTLCLAGAMYTHFFSVWLIACFNLYCILTWRIHRRHVKTWTISQLSMFALALPAFRTAFVVNEAVSKITIQWVPPPDMKTGLITFKGFFAAYSPSSWAYWPLFGLAMLLCALGLWTLRKRMHSMLLLGILAIVPVVGNVITWSVRDFSFYEHRLFIFSGAVCYMLAAAGALALPAKPLKGLALAALIALMLPCLRDHYARRIHPMDTHLLGVRARADARATAQAITARGEAGDPVGHTSHFTLFPLVHYLPEHPNALLGFSEQDDSRIVDSFPLESVWRRLDCLPKPTGSVVEGAPGSWLVQSSWAPHRGYAPYEQLFVRWMDAHFVRNFAAPYAELTLLGYKDQPALMNRVADWGSSVAPVYTDFEGDLVHEDQENLFDALTGALQAPPVEFGVYLEMGVGREDSEGDKTPNVIAAKDGSEIVGSFPFITDGPFTYRAIVRNAADASRELELTTYQSAASIVPRAFAPLDVTSSIWRPAYQTQNGTEEHRFGLPALATTIQEEAKAGAIARANVHLPPGEFDLFVEGFQTEAEGGRADFVLTTSGKGDAAPRTLGRFPGVSPNGQRGWQVAPVGSLHSDGEETILNIGVQPRDGNRPSRAALGRIWLVRHGTQLGLKRERLTLEPLREKLIHGNGMAIRPGPLRIELEVRDTASNDTRSVFFHAAASLPEPKE